VLIVARIDPTSPKPFHIRPLIATLTVGLILPDIALTRSGSENAGFAESIGVTNFFIGGAISAFKGFGYWPHGALVL
jgi:hypothetical protein